MKSSTFDTMTRHAAAVSRRGSFRVLGGAALTGALAVPAAANARNAGKKNSQKRCKKQRGQCLAYVAEFCQPKGDPSECQSDLGPCCEHFAQCNAGQGIECFIEGVLTG